MPTGTTIARDANVVATYYRCCQFRIDYYKSSIVLSCFKYLCWAYVLFYIGHIITYSIYTTHHTTIATARSHMRYLSAFSFLICGLYFTIIIGKTACPSRWNCKLTVQIGKCSNSPLSHSHMHLGCVHCPHPHNNLVLMRHCGVNRVVMTVDCCEWKIGQSVSLDK